MAKYLIEDIIPPEKKHRSVTKKKVAPGRSVAMTKEEQPTPEVKKTISEAYPENPKDMLVDQLRDQDAATAQTEVVPHAPAETPNENPAGSANTWPTKGEKSDMPIQETLTRFPPQFPAYAPKDLAYDDGGTRSWIPWLLGGAVLLVAGYFLFNFFESATVTVQPKRQTLALDRPFTAFKTEADSKLAYAIMVETASSTAEVSATGEKSVTTKASGQIVVYNEQTTAQRLIKNTRFQAPSGKIYRIRDSITIPKGTGASGAIKPGSLEVTVYADEAGEGYNSPPVDFTVPGLKNTAIYEKVYARSKGPLTGGASGVVKTVSDQDLQRAGEDLRIQLETKLRAKARGNLAGSQIAFDKGVVVNFLTPTLLNMPASATNKAVVGIEGTIAVVTFKRADITRAIVGAISPESAGDAVEIKNLDALTFTMDAQKTDALLLGNKIDFTLKGAPELAWIIDAATIQQAVRGLPKARFNETLTPFSSVERAEASLRPIWKTAFPDDPTKISVDVVEQFPAD